MKGNGRGFSPNRGRTRQFDENAAHFLDIFVLVENVFVPKQISEAKFSGLGFGLGAGVKRPVFRPQLLGGVARHPEGFFVGHSQVSPWVYEISVLRNLIAKIVLLKCSAGTWGMLGIYPDG
jgi:hypothetical protein